MRLFLALPLPEKYQQACLELVTGLSREIPAVKWTAGGNFHITLKFIGEVEEKMLPAVIKTAGEAVSGIPALTLSLEGTGAFPPRGTPRVIWAGVREEKGDLPILAGKLDLALHALGIPREKRPFQPHLTLGRPRPSAAFIDRKKLNRPFSTPAFQVSRVLLYRSTLTREGPVYQVEEKFPLG